MRKNFFKVVIHLFFKSHPNLLYNVKIISDQISWNNHEDGKAPQTLIMKKYEFKS